MENNFQIKRDQNIMTVTGTGKVKVIPDMVVIRLGVLTSGDNLSSVQEENARISQAVLESLNQIGITDIATFQYLIDKIYDFQNGIRIDRGFSVRHIFEIRTHMIDMSGIIIDTAVSMGANLVELISFEVSETETYYLEALSLALTNGTIKARSIAEKFNAKLNPIQTRIIENTSPSVSPSRTFLREDIVTTPIEPGATSIEAFVTLEFSYS
jgi:uncharacterized protein YggE